MACAPRAAPRASLGRRMPCPDSAGPEDRLIGQDPRIISRLVKGQSFVQLIERESSDAIAKGWGRLSWSSCRVLGWSSRWRWESMALGPAGVWRTLKGQINLSRPGPRSLHWSQAGTACLREYRPHNQGKVCRGNRDSEGPSKQRPLPGSCDQRSLGRPRSYTQKQDSDWLRTS